MKLAALWVAVSAVMLLASSSGYVVEELHESGVDTRGVEGLPGVDTLSLLAISTEEGATDEMTDEMEMQAKHSFMDLATSFKRPDSMTSLETIRLAREHLFGGHDLGETSGSKSGKVEENSALGLIFEKLDEMVREIQDEGKEQLDTLEAGRIDCAKAIADNGQVVMDRTAERQENKAEIDDHLAVIHKLWSAWMLYWADERAANKAVTDIQNVRQAACDIVSVEVDERNKAIDVMVKATFLVCESFPRYKSSPQCLEIQSQPDVVEPDRFYTKPPDEAKIDTELSHTAEPGTPFDDAPKWLRKWTTRINRDKNKEEMIDPEGLLVSAEHRNQYNDQFSAKEKGPVHWERMSRLHERNFGDHGDGSVQPSESFTYDLDHGYTATLSGWTHTRDYAMGFLNRQSDGTGTGQAVVSGLVPEAEYHWVVYQYAGPDGSGDTTINTNQMTVNDGAPFDTTSVDSEAATGEGNITATDAGEITFKFIMNHDSNRMHNQVHLSGISVGKITREDASEGTGERTRATLAETADESSPKAKQAAAQPERTEDTPILPPKQHIETKTALAESKDDRLAHEENLSRMQQADAMEESLHALKQMHELVHSMDEAVVDLGEGRSAEATLRESLAQKVQATAKATERRTEDPGPNEKAKSATTEELGESAAGEVEAAVDAEQQVQAKARVALQELLTHESPQLAHKYKLQLESLQQLIELEKGHENDLKEGLEAGRGRSIVDVLLNILMQIRQIQDEAVASHTERLNAWYESIDQLVEGLMATRKDEGFDAKTGIMHSQTSISNLQISNEAARLDQNRAWNTRMGWEDRCTKAEEEYANDNASRVDDLENVKKLKSLLRGIYNKKMPKLCPKFGMVMCSSQEAGWCIFNHITASGPDAQYCSCNPGFYGESCQFRKCPGFASTQYEQDALGVCSDRGTCDHLTGQCTCFGEFYHGPKNACDYKHAPPSKNGAVDNKCTEESGIHRGTIDKVRGYCHCKGEYYGGGCEEKRCPASNGVLYPAVSGNVCNGHGACNVDDGICECHGHYYSGDKKSCEEGTCGFACGHHGVCNYHTGECVCDDLSYGQFCQHRYCPNMIDYDCSGGGKCNRNKGDCICKTGYSGPICAQTERCSDARLKDDNMNWWTIWDTPGWLLCPKGQLMYKLERSACWSLPDPDNDPEKSASTGGALSCIESGGCAAPCEDISVDRDGPYVFQFRHCYHSLRMYNEFDHAGWSKCRTDYFVAGLYRTCESLYCLNMMKCCSLSGGEAYHYSQAGTQEVWKDEQREEKVTIPLGNTHQTRYHDCGETLWGSAFNGKTSEQLVGTVPEGAFITGFKRGVGHTLSDILEASYCHFARGY